MTTRHAAPKGKRPARHTRRERTHRVLRVVALVTTAVLAFGGAGTAAALQVFQSSMASADVTELLGDRPTPPPADPSAGRAVTILLIGSDVRDGENGEIGGAEDGMRSDTAIVMHISADRSRVEAVSIPRDSLVDIPACERSDGTTSKATNGMFNSAFSTGSQSGEVSDAAACTIKTVEQNTGVFIDHWVVIDFSGFVSMVDALGGVSMCIPQDIDSPKAALKLSAGYQVLGGRDALGYARARTGTGLGNGSDTDRLVRQQKLLAATVSDIRSSNLLTDLPALGRFLLAATSSVTVDQGLNSIGDMTGLVLSLKDTQTENITFLTVPFAAAPSDKNRVVWTKDADALWANMAADLPILTPAPGSTATTAAPEVVTPEPDATPAPAPAGSAEATDGAAGAVTPPPATDTSPTGAAGCTP